MKLLNYLLAAIFTIIISIGFTACGGGDDELDNYKVPENKTVKVESVSISATTVNITEGGSQTITVSVSPANATNKKYTFSSSDPSVATVDENGKITALKSGEVTITVTTADGSKTATCKVTVTVKEVAVESVALDKTELTIEEEQSEKLIATINPDDATNTDMTWASSDESILTVDKDGKISALKAGEATVTVTTADGQKTAVCKVTVTAKVIPVNSVSLNKTELTIKVDETETLSAIISPNNATNADVTWKSSDTSIATVDKDGKITAISRGTVTITVTTSDGNKVATCKVTVKNKGEITTIREALEDFYYSLDGDNWTNRSGWLSDQPYSTWYGLTASGDKITAINLEGNNLKGYIPESIGLLVDLSYINLHGDNHNFGFNYISGSIPSSICNLTKLKYLDLGENFTITGKIPANIGNLYNLEYMNLCYNDMGGDIPASIGNLIKLYNLQLQSNNFTSLPDEIFNLSNLTALILYDNRIIYTITKEQQETDMWKNLELTHFNDQQPGYYIEIEGAMTYIELNAKSITVKVGETFDFFVKNVLPADADKSKIEWHAKSATKFPDGSYSTTEDGSIITIDKDGKMTAVAAGEGWVEAWATDKGGATGLCTVIVTEE
ncbi:MAG: Ig-like domain-containing protein [Bacteroidaceae bacterium]|nr:Ig-like domain-containing protein [Bacteroidaceae bacterium]